MIIRFKYKISPVIAELMSSNIIGYYDEYLYGMLDDSIASDLKHCSMYIVCPSNLQMGKQINENPVGVVAHNMEEAIEWFYSEFKTDGYIVGEIESRCDNLKVEPV